MKSVLLIGAIMLTAVTANAKAVSCKTYFGSPVAVSISASHITLNYRGAISLRYNGIWGGNYYFRNGGNEIAIVQPQVMQGNAGHITYYFTKGTNGRNQPQQDSTRFYCN